MNEGERRNALFQTGKSSPKSFYHRLFMAIYSADMENRRKLALGFPEEVESANRWNNEDGYAQKLLAELEGKT